MLSASLGTAVMAETLGSPDRELNFLQFGDDSYIASSSSGISLIGFNPEIIQNSNLISEVNNTRGKTAAALTYYSFIRDPLVLVNSGGDLISSAWNHSSNESGHYYQTCSTDTKGNTSCTQHYVCDYIDHTWTFNPSRAAQGIKTYLEGSTTLNSDRSKHPKTVNISFLDKLMKDNLLKEGEKDLTPEQKEERIKQLTDWLKSVTIKGNNTVVADISYLIGASQGGELSWLNDNYTNTRLFPLISKDRDNSCGSGVAPKGYNVSQRFDSKTDRTMQHYANVISRTSGSVELLKKYKSKLLEINTELKRGASANDVEDQYDELGEIAIELHKKFNPKSSYKSLSKGWRTAIPIMLLCGLGSLGGIGGYFLLKKYEDKKYRSRMRRYSIYS